MCRWGAGAWADGDARTGTRDGAPPPHAPTQRTALLARSRHRSPRTGHRTPTGRNIALAVRTTYTSNMRYSDAAVRLKDSTAAGVGGRPGAGVRGGLRARGRRSHATPTPRPAIAGTWMRYAPGMVHATDSVDVYTIEPASHVEVPVPVRVPVACTCRVPAGDAGTDATSAATATGLVSSIVDDAPLPACQALALSSGCISI